jgi:hypothetical protein
MNLRARTSRVLLNDGDGRALSCEQIVALIEAADGVRAHHLHVVESMRRWLTSRRPPPSTAAASSRALKCP